MKAFKTYIYIIHLPTSHNKGESNFKMKHEHTR